MTDHTAPVDTLTETDDDPRSMTDVTAGNTATAITRQTMVSGALVVALLAAAVAGAVQFTSLSSKVEHMTEQLTEVKASLRSMQDRQMNVSTNNSSTIALVLERMRADDERERRDTTAIDALLVRVTKLENGK